MSQSGKKIKCNVHIAQYFKKLKGNQTMIFVQLIKYNMRNISLENSKKNKKNKKIKKCGRETIPRLISKKLKLSKYLDQ